MNIVTHTFNSSVGRKFIMAVTGCLLLLFVLGHLAGNLQIFLGREAINRYGHFLQSNPEIIWPARLVLLVAVGLHIWAAAKLSVENKTARPVAYAMYQPVGSSYASRTMLMSGLILLAFIIYHLLHFTFQVQSINGTGQDFTQLSDLERRHDVFKMMILGFSNGWVSAFYLVGMGLLCLHLSHGASSFLQSLGWKNEAYRPLIDQAARVLAVLIFLGYASIPAAILLGLVKDASK